ncbi:hypothetical protein YC2023_072246 [Brassica napus]
MPRHLICDAHEWINEIPTVPVYYPGKPQPRERALQNQRGKKTLLSLTLVRLYSLRWVNPGGGHCQVGSLAGAAHLLKDELNESRNIVWNKRVKAHMILIFHQVLDCSPTNRERELGLDRHETD